ncbi:MAG: sodium:solute symporter [Bacteroidia bacterium]|nr:MAG: sodium:solute symporter [Bacteroidia bacterium]
MVLVGIILYLLITIGVGLRASRRVHNSTDFLLASKKLGIGLSTAALFATWFGAETIIGASSEMAEKGVQGIIEDPLGAALCLFLLGTFFAKPLYRLNLMTFGDFYAQKYNKATELIASLALTLSYLGWIAGQIVALGVIFHEIIGIPQIIGTFLGTSIVLLYTYYGGMWSVATLDALQNFVIVIGLLAILLFIAPDLLQTRTIESLPSTYFQFFPDGDFHSWSQWLSTWFIVGLGSLPGQDIFQRVMSSKNEVTAQKSAWLASFLYVVIGSFPLLIAVYIRVYAPQFFQEGSQNMLIQFVNSVMPVWVQLLFMGALVSAIMSSASGAIMAPSAIIAENLYPFFWGKPNDQQLLKISRISVVIVGLISLLITFLNDRVFELVGMSAAISGVSLFVPMVYGLYMKRHTSTGAILSIFLGLIAYFYLKFTESIYPDMFWGLAASWLGMILGNFLERPSTKS